VRVALMQGVVTWETLLGLGTILAAVAGVWFRIEWKVGDLIGDAVKPITDAQASMRAEHAVMRAENVLLREHLAEHKLYAANHYAKMGDVREMREEIIARLDHMNGRLDKAFAPAPSPPAPVRPR
jgi:hypothetical protein